MEKERAGTMTLLFLCRYGNLETLTRHRTLIYIRRSRAGTVAVTVLDKAGLQGLYVVTERPVLGIGAKQGLEEGNGDPVLGMGVKQGLEEGNGEPVLGMGAKQGLEARDVHTDGTALRTAKP